MCGGNRQGFRIISDTRNGIPLDTIISDLIGKRIDNGARTEVQRYTLKTPPDIGKQKRIRLKHNDRITISPRFISLNTFSTLLPSRNNTGA